MSLKNLPLIVAALLLSPTALRADSLDFSTFVADGPIVAATGSGATIAFTYAGNEFVGSTYFDNQLYSTSLSGGSVAAFGNPLPASSGSVGEVVIGASLGNGGFPNGGVFVGSQASGIIYQYANSGGAPSTFATLPATGTGAQTGIGTGVIRQIFFDPGSTFGGDMLVATSAGFVFKVTSAGVVTQLAYVGEDCEGMDIAPSTFGPYAGDLMLSSEGSGLVRLINPAGTIVGALGTFDDAETVSAIPSAVDASNPEEGFYVANYSTNIQFAQAGQFTGSELGSVIITSEVPGSNAAWDVTYNIGTGTFTSTPFDLSGGNSISQFEDGIFVSPQRLSEGGGGGGGSVVPEPSTLLLLGTSLLGLGGAVRRRFVS